MKYTEVERAVNEAIDAFEWGYVKYIMEKLASYRDSIYGFRLAGGEAERKAVEFIAKELEKFDVKEIELQEVPVHKWVFNDAFVETLNSSTRYVFKGVTYAGFPPAEVEGPVIYAGKGTKNDFKDKNVRGRVVLIELDETIYNTPLPAFREASARGAVGVVVTDHKKLNQGPAEALFTADGEYVGGVPPVIFLAPRDFLSLKEIVFKESEVHTRLKIDTILEEGVAYNVVGILGKGQRDNIIISAHHDAHFKGVVDNASGVAAVLLLAKAFSRIDLDKDIYFISFTAEEFGKTETLYDYLIGSYYFFENNLPIVEKNWLYINFDGVGEGGGPIGILYTPEIGEFVSDTLSHLTDQITTGFHLVSKPSLWLDQWPGVYHGLSSVAFTNLGHKTFFTKFYHTQFDDINLVNENVFRDYFITSYVLSKRFCELNVPPYDYSKVSLQIAKTLDMGIFSYSLENLEKIEELISSISMKAIKLYKLITEVNGGRYPAGIDRQKLVKGLLLSRSLLLRTIYWINPLELAPLHPSLLTEIYQQLFNILESYGDYTPQPLTWISNFSKETVEWVLHKISKDDYWAKGKTHNFPIHITESGIIPDEKKLISDFNLVSNKLLEDLEIIDKILLGLLEVE